MFPIRHWQFLATILFSATLALQAQPPAPGAGQAGQNPTANPQAQPLGAGQTRELPPGAIRPNYVLRPNDQFLMRTNVEELNEKPFRIDADGNVNLPLLSRVHVGGMTVE